MGDVIHYLEWQSKDETACGMRLFGKMSWSNVMEFIDCGDCLKALSYRARLTTEQQAIVEKTGA